MLTICYTAVQKRHKVIDLVKIRNAVFNDAAALADLSSQLGYPAANRETVDRLSAILRSDDHTVFVACMDDGSIVGWAHVFFTLRVQSDPFAELGGLIVAERCRRRGIGKRLLAAVEEWVNHRGITKLRVRSRLTRSDAHSFYERLGFSRTKEQHIFDKLMKSNG